ncbi:MAG: GTP-binding protein [Candidatus Heimdallarchaeota archaeon]|jgi:small GTP-binding protein|nr:GTP-binding protein [Candidatus Heimdallarchaeota archaeon]MCK4876760.1 GTP-binding protein [Candidatus Heimdallarchaeota archaeon]NHK33090.1 GTP-binding protein [Asgard group archaeon]
MAAGQRKIFKITLLGDGAVGKTSLRKTYLGEGFKDGYSMTIGADFAVKRLRIDDQDFVAQIWDLAGQQRFSAVREVYYRGTSGCLLVFDISRRSSFENIPSWIAELLKNNSNRVVPIVLIGNKSDLRSTAKDPIMREQAEEYARSLSGWSGFTVPYIETSAKTGENVDEAFKTLLKNIVLFYEKLYAQQ